MRVIGAAVLIVIIVLVLYFLGMASPGAYVNTSKTSISSSISTIATISSAATTASSTTTVIASMVPPKVTITSPKNLSTVNGVVNITANVIDPAGIRTVQFYLGKNLSWTSNSTPYYYLWNTSNAAGSEYMITVKAYDYANNTGEASILVDVGLVQHGK